MSSYANRYGSAECAQVAQRLIQAAHDIDDVTFERTIDGITSIRTMRAVAAHAIETLVASLDEALNPPPCIVCDLPIHPVLGIVAHHDCASTTRIDPITGNTLDTSTGKARA